MAGHGLCSARNNLIAAVTLALCLVVGIWLAGCGQSGPAESIVLPTSIGPDVEAPAVSTDKSALAALYIAMDGENWLNNDNWLSDAPVGEWHGVSADDSGRVTGLALAHNGLKGEIPPELGDITRLEKLELWRNELSGAMPPELGNLTNLKLLDLGENRLTGGIPPELRNLSRLKGLYLYVNDLTGEIPPELGVLSNLEKMNLSGNRLTGRIPPELGKLSNLSLLDVGENRLHGEIPPELSGLINLEELFLGGNSGLTGCIHGALRNIPKNDLSSLGLPLCPATGPSVSNALKTPLPTDPREQKCAGSVLEDIDGLKLVEPFPPDSSDAVRDICQDDDDAGQSPSPFRQPRRY